MNAFVIVALLGAIAGLSMVLGGIWLVAKGLITMAATPKADALTIEWKKQFRINTQVPGLAFFLVGLMSITTSLVFLKPSDADPIEFEGQIRGIEGQVSILVRPSNWILNGDSATGRISGNVYPDFSFLVLSINAPGYEPLNKQVRVNLTGQRIANLGMVELRRSPVSESDLTRQIAPIPFSSPSLATTRAPTFGAPL
ncbi:hypothetical protein P3G55_19420 [Leptospira sp. 96542]|nr:hypothetical protein [Leptospira sp. 96542]